MIEAYIDESGNLGRKGEFFVIAAIVFDSEDGKKKIKRIIHREQAKVAWENHSDIISELKFSQLDFEQRQRILTKIASKENVYFFYIVIRKQNTELLKTSSSKNLIYNYFARLLTDMIFSAYDDDFRIVFDQRSTRIKSMNSLIDYIKISAMADHRHFNKRIEISQEDSKLFNNLQAADMISGAIYTSYTHNYSHFMNIIKPKIIKNIEFPKSAFKNLHLK